MATMLKPNPGMERESNLREIRTFINNGDMKVEEFQNKLGVSAASYRAFMNASAPSNGMQSDTFISACFFFKKREIAGLKMPRAKKAKTSDGATTKKVSAAEKDKTDDKYDVSGITLDHEDKLPVPIYDTCDDLRTKINQYMQGNANSTNAGFVRIINAAAFPVNATKPTIATPAQMSTFLKGSGPVKGAGSPVFYVAYVFSRNCASANGKPKTKKREELEKVGKNSGMDREDFTNRPIFARADEVPYINSYGQLQIGGRTPARARYN
ncbi:hypothetical protein LTR84_012547 [Exophiala bonariae]|uniref:DUF7726 domain-containing protein n=1 Tax=Exophiala bonariae TaxID=1690606 RepID=A0AAV9NEI5_9EURO|nr:hypothetical protein LTR84_012547 [Exophiala bonariae]